MDFLENIIKQLYELAENEEVEDDALINVLNLRWCDDHHVYSDGVADLAALMEESMSSQG